MSQDYVEKDESGYRIAGAGVSLGSVVYAFLDGLSPESIADNFPVLTVEEVYGAVAYYLGHRQEVDAHLERVDAQFVDLGRRTRERYPLLNRELDRALVRPRPAEGR